MIIKGKLFKNQLALQVSVRFKHHSGYVYQWAIFAMLLLFLWALGDSRAVLLFSGLIAYLCHPLLLRLESRGASRALATTAISLAILTPIIIILVVAVPFLANSIAVFIRSFPDWMTVAFQKAEVFTKEWGFELPVRRTEIINLISEKMQLLSFDTISSATDVVKRSAITLSGAVLVLLNIILLPVFFVYVLLDFERWRDGLTDLVPISLRPLGRRLSARANIIVGSYLRGQLLASTILAVLYGGGLQLIGLPFGWLIGGLTGFFSFIPYLGFSSGFTIALITAVASGGGGQQVSLVFLVMGIVQIFESFILIPRLVGRFVGLRPLEALIALIVCGNLFGFGGLLLAIPAGAMFKEAFLELRRLSEV